MGNQDFDSSNYPYLKYSAFSTALISLISILLVFVVFLSRPALRKFSFRLILYLQFADAIMSICMMLEIADPIEHKDLCQAQAFIGNFGCLSSFMWTCCISSSIYFSCTGKWKNVESKEKYFLFVCNVFPFVISAIPFWLSGNEYGVSGYWCWIIYKTYQNEPETTRNLLFVFTLFFFLWIAVVYNVILIILTLRYFHNPENRALLTHYNHQLKKTLMFPMVMVVLWTIPSIYRILQLYDINIFWLSFVHAVCEGINGLINTLVYVWSKKFKEEMRQTLRVSEEWPLISRL